MEEKEILGFRKREREVASEMEALVTEHYLALCELMSKQEMPFVVRTPFGMIQFMPDTLAKAIWQKK